MATILILVKIGWDDSLLTDYTKPKPGPMLCCLIVNQSLMNKLKGNFYSRKCIWICRLQNKNNHVQSSMCLKINRLCTALRVLVLALSLSSAKWLTCYPSNWFCDRIALCIKRMKSCSFQRVPAELKINIWSRDCIERYQFWYLFTKSLIYWTPFHFRSDFTWTK